MFAGIIQKTAAIQAVATQGEGRVVRITKPAGWKLKAGVSVAVDGICSTVVRTDRATFTVEYMPETLRCSTARFFKRSSLVNLERSLLFGAPIDGHFVQGHVEGTAKVARIAARGNSRDLTLRIPRALVRFIATKGSITINGVALTVARMRGSECTVALIPYTLAHTDLGALETGDHVNLETDLLARYLAQLVKK